jgi:hypothetical protein
VASSPKRTPPLAASASSSPTAGPSLSRQAESEGKRKSGLLNIRDELLMSLLASEAVVDSREFDILNAEEVENLKRVGVKYIITPFC